MMNSMSSNESIKHALTSTFSLNTTWRIILSGAENTPWRVEYTRVMRGGWVVRSAATAPAGEQGGAPV